MEELPDTFSDITARYLKLALFIAALVLPIWVAEAVFRAGGGVYSVTDTRGAGQVALYAVILICAAAFSLLIGRESVGSFWLPYLRGWRRALAGLGAMWLAASLAVFAGYAIFAMTGHVRATPVPADVDLSHLAERTLVALVVMLVLILTEELLFRALVMRYLRATTGRVVTVAAVLVSAGVFAAAHNVLNPLPWLAAEHLKLFTGLFLLGTLLATTYVATGSLTCAMGVHAGFLGSKVFLRKTALLDVSSDTWLLGYSDDLRMAPVAWLIFAGLALTIYLARHRLRTRFAIERPVTSRPQW